MKLAEMFGLTLALIFVVTVHSMSIEHGLAGHRHRGSCVGGVGRGFGFGGFGGGIVLLANGTAAIQLTNGTLIPIPNGYPGVITAVTGFPTALPTLFPTPFPTVAG